MKQAYALAGAGLALAALMMLIIQLTASPPATPAAAAAAVGPSVAAAPPVASAAQFSVPAVSIGPDIAIALDDRQMLIADSALRAVMDFYLKDGRLQALREHLQRTLPPAAAAQAVLLAERYSAYLADHDQLLAAQNFSATPDVGRLGIWQQQRRQLRERMLGEGVTEEWFGTEDAYLSQALAELASSPDAQPPSDDEVRHREHMQQVLREAVFSARRP